MKRFITFFLCTFFIMATNHANGETLQRVYIGTYTNGDSEGIYQLDFNPENGDIKLVGLAAETGSPSYLVEHPTLAILYAAASGDSLRAFSINKASGNLTLLNEQPSGGRGPCHITISPDGQRVATANYGGGSVSFFGTEKNGALTKSVAFFQHEGSSANPKRQEGPHAHSVNFDLTGRYCVAADLGTDELRVYHYNQTDGAVTAHAPSAVSTAPGAGPRHFCFHPNNKNAYVVNELDNTVTAYAWDFKQGILNPIQTLGTLPSSFEGNNSTAHIITDPKGRFLYASNRGHDSIAVFGIASGGKLDARGHTSTGGVRPRNFGVDPTGNYLLAANQDTHNVVVLKINQQDGTLTPTGKEVKVPNPVCVLFAR